MNKFIKFIIFSFVLVLGLGLASYFYVVYAIARPNQGGPETHKILINPGTGSSVIGRTLEKEKLINSYALFWIYVKVTKPTLEAGLYEVPGNLSLKEVVELLQHGTNDVKATFIEGMRAEEYALQVSKELSNVKYGDFMNIVKTQNLEGKLFPDTYFLAGEITAEDVINKMTENFKEKTTDLFKENKTGLSEKEVLILASLVEREEASDAERPTVAGILVNRFKNGEALGTDATIQYIFGTEKDFWPKDITLEQLAVDSPYNTRKVAGLPPTPICNPGLSAIKAVLNYKDTDFAFYLHDKNGKVHYAKTLEEHNRNASIYLN